MRRRQTLAFYRSHMGRVSKFVGISQQEIDVMARHFPKPKPYLASYGIPLEEFAVLPSSGEEFVLGFIGNYGHPPNVDVLRWLAEGLADTIRLHCPGVRFALAGKGIPAWAHKHFRDQKDVRIYENVQNLKDFYSGISVFLNPIRTGRGMRTKLVEAAAFGRPIVSTTLGAEGLDDLQITCADDAQGLAEACLALSRDARLGASTARNRMIIENHYSLGKIGAELLDFLISAQ